MRKWGWLTALAVLWPVLALGQAQVDAGAGAPTGPASAVSHADLAAERAARLKALAAAESEVATAAAAAGAAAESNAGDMPKGDAEAKASDAQPAGPAGGIPFTAETAAAYQNAWQAYYAYRAEGYTHRQRVFDWQDVSTKITFGVVVLLVLAGVYFAAVQFHVGMRAGRATGEAGEIEMSVKGIKVRSPVLGVIVLTISLAFFYLYLIYVSPIENIF